MMEFQRARFWVKVAHLAYGAGWHDTSVFAIKRAQHILARHIEQRYPIMRDIIPTMIKVTDDLKEGRI